MKVLKLFTGAVLMSTISVMAQAPAAPAAPQPPRRAPFTVTSPDFQDGDVMPNKFTQSATGPYVSPKLTWTNAADSVVTFALILNDQDTVVQRGPGMAVHWMIFNIPGTARELPEGASTPEATLADGSIQAINQAKRIGYLGMGAGPGPYHHYTIELYALDTKLALGPDATQKDVEAAMTGHILQKSVLVVRYHK